MPTKELKKPKIVKNAAEFASIWNSNKEELLNRNPEVKTEIPNIYRRQDRLVGQVLDACIILHVYEELKDSKGFNSLRFLFPDKDFKQKDFDALSRMAQEDKELLKAGKPSKLLPMLVEMATKEDKQLKKTGKQLKNQEKELKDYTLSNHTLLFDQEKWIDYKKKFKNYILELDKHEGSHTIPNIAIPEDPRITKIKDDIQTTVQILNCGPKKHTAIHEKAKRISGDVSELRDIVRIGVLPKKLEYANDFIDIMKLLNHDKKVDADGHTASRIYVDRHKVCNNGYFDRKILVAQDRLNDKDPKKVTKSNVGTIAEVKVFPAGMHQAERLTAVIKQVLNLFEDKEIRYTTANPNDHDTQVELNRDRLAIEYAKQKLEFKKLTEKDGESYKDKWPAFDLQKMSKEEVNYPETYQKLKDDLNKLAIVIHVDAIMDEHRTWKDEYLRTVIRQELVKNPKWEVPQDLPPGAPKLEPDDPRLVPSITGLNDEGKCWLRKIANTKSIDLEDIERKVKAELELEKAAKQAQAHR